MAPIRLKRNIDYISVLKKANKQQRNAILQTANRDLILCLCECALNTLNGNIPLKNTDLKKLERHKKPLRKLADNSTKISDKQSLLIQKGGFLPALLSPILAILGQILVNEISKK